MSSPAIRVLQRTKMGPDCWEWQGYKMRRGYGQINVEGRHLYVHRVLYEWAVGPIPAGREVHHDCENRACVNPDHLRALSPEDHRALHARKNASTRRSAAERRPCKRGHSPEHRRVNGQGNSVCHECVLENKRAYYARKQSR